MKTQSPDEGSMMMRRRRRGRFGRLIAGLRLFGLPLVLAATATGCVATLGTEADYAYADDVPPDVTVYPSTEYDGHVVYLVHDHYYYRGPEGRWVYYRRVPAPLYERRATMVRARPAVRERHYVQHAPRVRRAPPRRYEHERRVAPELRSPVPATQVR